MFPYELNMPKIVVMNPFFIMMLLWNYYLTKCDNGLKRWDWVVDVWGYEPVQYWLNDINDETSKRILDYIESTPPL